MHRPISSLLVLALTFAIAATGAWSPATAQDGTPAALTPAAITDEMMFSYTFPGEALPTAPARAVFYRLTLPPGVYLPMLVGPFCGCPGAAMLPGVGVEIVEEGTYTLWLGAPFEVQRVTVDGTPPAIEQIPTNSEVTLGPGDVAVYVDYAAIGEIRGGGATQVTVAGLAIVSETETGTPAPSLPSDVVADELSRAIPSDLEKLPPGPVTVALRRVTLPPGVALPQYEPQGLQAIDVQAGQVGVAYVLPGETAPSRPATIYGVGQTAPFLPLKAGTKVAITNDGDEPASLLVLTIAPVAA